MRPTERARGIHVQPGRWGVYVAQLHGSSCIGDPRKAFDDCSEVLQNFNDTRGFLTMQRVPDRYRARVTHEDKTREVEIAERQYQMIRPGYCTVK